MQLKSIKHAIRLQLQVLLGSLLLISLISLWAIEKIRINGPLYADISESKALVTDILPPPLFIVEPYLSASRLAMAAPAERAALTQLLTTQIAEYRKTLADWQQSGVPEALRVELFEKSAPAAQAFIEVIESQLIPAAHAEDDATMRDVLRVLEQHFVEHRASIVRLVALGEAQARTVEQSANHLARLKILLLILASLSTLALGFALSRQIGALITNRVSSAVEAAEAVARGALDRPIAPGDRHDEIREILVSLENMRQALATNLHDLETQKAELRHRGEIIAEAKTKLEMAERLKSDFLANMTHELKTPLNGVIGMLQLLHLAELDAENQEYLGMAEKSAGQLLALIDDMLFYARIQANPERIEQTPFGLTELAQSVANRHARRASEKSLKLELKIDEGTPEVILGQAEYLSRALDALMNNAVKFTPAGRVELHLSTSTEATGEWLHFDIKDSGPGLPEDRLVNLFGLFNQQDASMTRQHGGSGLGLALAQALALSMNGKLQASNLPEGGAHFRLSLPFSRNIAII